MSDHGVQHVPAGEGSTIWVGDDVYTFKATSKTTGGALSFVEASVPPGAGPPPHAHDAADEAFYLLSGELEMLAGERTFEASSGDFVFVPRGVIHRFRNPGLHVARMVFFHIPGGFDEYLTRIGTPAVAGDAPPPFDPAGMEEAMRIAPEYGLTMPPAPDAPPRMSDVHGR